MPRHAAMRTEDEALFVVNEIAVYHQPDGTCTQNRHFIAGIHAGSS